MKEVGGAGTSGASVVLQQGDKMERTSPQAPMQKQVWEYPPSVLAVALIGREMKGNDKGA